MTTRREFLQDVGAGVVAASVGSGLAADLGFSTAFAQQGAERLTFGNLEPLVSLMQETAAARLIPQVVERLRGGTALRDVVAAAALANARTFGGEDYIGFHTMMAIGPAYHMAQELPENRKALPVLKVLHRNATRIQEQGGTAREVLRPVTAAELPANRVAGEVLRDAVRAANNNPAAAERTFAAMAGSADDALNNVLYEVQDGADVHRVVLPYRSWDLMGIIGRDHAHTLLRQSVRFCVRGENANSVRYYGTLRTAIPRLLDQHRLIGRDLGTRVAEDRWVEALSNTIFRGTPEQAADAAAAALAEGMDPAAVSEAISLAANQLVLRDNGRANAEGPNKPAGSIHGDSIGVHACDSANAWRNLSRVGNARNKVVCLLLGAWQVARDRGDRGGSFLTWQPYPREEARLEVRKLENNRLLASLEDAIRNRSQIRAAALTHRYLETNQPIRPLWDLLLREAISEDGALHHEKFYRTTVEEFTSVRTAFKARYLIALSRVTASGHGYAAPGHTEACRLLGV
jgi:hypothetical protein